MKRFLLIVTLLLACLLFGCDKQEDPVPLYYNLPGNLTASADENGIYTVNFIKDDTQVTYQVADEELFHNLLLQDFVGLQLDGNTITGITLLSDMPYKRLAWDYYVQSIGGGKAKLNASALFSGDELLLDLPEDAVVYDCSPLAKEPGTATELMKNDRASVIADMDGKILYVYVTDRAAVLGTEKIFCPHCEGDTYWYEWYSETALPTAGGHYILMQDINLISTAKMGNTDVCLELNGKTVTQTAYGKQIYTLDNGGTLSIMDSVGGGKFIPASTDMDAPEARKWGMIINTEAVESTVNLYGGTLDASACTAQYGCAVNQTLGTLNMYGGEILGGTAYGTGSTAIRVGGNFNMYGGRIAGGKHINIGYDSINIEGGATIRSTGIITIYDGIIEGGESYTNGGSIYLADSAKLVMKGGTITGGKSAEMGGGVFATGISTVTISGNAKITGNEGSNLWIDGLVKVYIGDEGLGEDALIGISMTNPGDFLYSVPEGTEITKHFVSDTPSHKLVKSGTDGWALK